MNFVIGKSVITKNTRGDTEDAKKSASPQRPMKNTVSLALILLLLSAVLGCGFFDRVQNEVAGSNNANANKTMTDRAVETAVGETKIGVQECDDALNLLATYVNDPNDGFVVKAGKTMLANTIRDSIKNSVEQNQTDKVQLAKDCARFKTEIEKQMTQPTNTNTNATR